MQTIEHLEGTMTDSEEGHSSEVNMFSTRIKLETDRETSAIFHHLSEYYYPNKNTKESRTLCHYHEGYEVSCNHRELNRRSDFCLMTDTTAALKLTNTKIFLTGFDVASPVSSILYTLII